MKVDYVDNLFLHVASIYLVLPRHSFPELIHLIILASRLPFTLSLSHGHLLNTNTHPTHPLPPFILALLSESSGEEKEHPLLPPTPCQLKVCDISGPQPSVLLARKARPPIGMKLGVESSSSNA